MAEKKEPRSIGSRVKRNMVAGVLTAIPIVVTCVVFKFLLDILAAVGRPIVGGLSDLTRPHAPGLADLLTNPWFESALAVVLVVLAIFLLGWVVSRVVGAKLMALFDRLMDRIPLVKTIYGPAKTLLTTFQQKPDGVQRVVLIDFPSTEMKTVGFVTRTLVDQDSGRELAAVYVPTTPNPTSGYLEIVPVEKITSTNWTMDEAMTFVVSGGAVAPPTMNYDRSASPPASRTDPADAAERARDG